MFELIVEGSMPRHRQTHFLKSPQSYTVGRDACADIVVEWDECISREHVQLVVSASNVAVRRLPSATNPLFFAGESVESCLVAPGGRFVIGTTSFRIVHIAADADSPDATPVEEITFDRQSLEKVRFRDADKRIEVLTHLPEMIRNARSEADLYERLVNLLIAGVLRSEAAAIVELDDDEIVHVRHWDRRRQTAGEFHPSKRLVRDALLYQKRSVLHVWDSAASVKTEYTVAAECDWAFCTPIRDSRLGLVLAGRLDQASAGRGTRFANDAEWPLRSDVKFAELVAEIVRSLRRTIELERQQSGLRQFFAPPILSALGNDLDTDILEPRECDVTVMFCDLRGFSQQAEEAADDLINLLDRVGRALGVMTRAILTHGGVTGDFQGDAALGFWGWPFPSDASVLDACKAALEIRKSFTKTVGQAGHPLADFQTGIGVATGRAVAGKIGTAEQVKVTVFGPVVNLASRLESMTKQLRVPILLDETTANVVRTRMPADMGRIRRLARLQPYGMETPLTVSELLPPETELPELTDEHVKQYERGVDRFIAGDWSSAYTSLHAMPASDRAQDFLTMLIAQHDRVAPADWDGIVQLSAK